MRLMEQSGIGNMEPRSGGVRTITLRKENNTGYVCSRENPSLVGASRIATFHPRL